MGKYRRLCRKRFVNVLIMLSAALILPSANAETTPSIQTVVGTPVSGYWFEGGVFPDPHQACYSHWPYLGNYHGAAGWYTQQAEPVYVWDASVNGWVVPRYTCLLFYLCSCSDNGIYKREGSISVYKSDCVTGEKVGNTCITYSCPSSGGWTLSSDKQTCSRCPDPAFPILTSDNACVGAEDKSTGSSCEKEKPNKWQ